MSLTEYTYSVLWYSIKRKVAIVTVGIIFIVVLYSYHDSIYVPEYVSVFSLISIFGSLTLSAMLVVLYSKQQDILRANHKSLLEVEGFNIEGDSVEIRLSNYGNGPITNLQLYTFLVSDDIILSKEHGSKLTKIASDNSRENPTGNSLKPKGESVVFEAVAVAGFFKQDGEEVQGTVSDAMKILKDDGSEYVEVSLVVKGNDLLDESEEVELMKFPRRYDLDGRDIHLQAAISDGKEVHTQYFE